MKLLFRVDDIYLDNSVFEEDLFKLFNKYDVPLLLGVIPFDLNEKPVITAINDDINNLIDKQKLIVALHGFKHIQNETWGEFYGVHLEHQITMIEKGKNHLESVIRQSVTCFIPPWNAFDNNTITALTRLNFKMVTYGHDFRTNGLDSDDLCLLKYSVEHLFFLHSLTFKIICFLSYFGFFKNLVILILFHPYNFIDWQNKPYFKNNKERFNSSLLAMNNLFFNMKKNKNIVYESVENINVLKHYRNPLLELIYKIETRRVLKLYKSSK